jgi:hypothetical protein
MTWKLDRGAVGAGRLGGWVWGGRPLSTSAAEHHPHGGRAVDPNGLQQRSTPTQCSCWQPPKQQKSLHTCRTRTTTRQAGAAGHSNSARPHTELYSCSHYLPSAEVGPDVVYFCMCL